MKLTKLVNPVVECAADLVAVDLAVEDHHLEVDSMEAELIQTYSLICQVQGQDAVHSKMMTCVTVIESGFQGSCVFSGA